jgi:spore coat protein D
MSKRKDKNKVENHDPFMNDIVLDDPKLGNRQDTFIEHVGEEKTIVDPAEKIVNTTTTRHKIRRVHPINITNVNRNVYRVEDYYPVEEDFVNENIVEYYECGNDPDDYSNCKAVKRPQK